MSISSMSLPGSCCELPSRHRLGSVSGLCDYALKSAKTELQESDIAKTTVLVVTKTHLYSFHPTINEDDDKTYLHNLMRAILPNLGTQVCALVTDATMDNTRAIIIAVEDNKGHQVFRRWPIKNSILISGDQPKMGGRLLGWL